MRALAICAVAVALAACSFHDYCINCESPTSDGGGDGGGDDGGNGDGMTGDGGPCIPDGPEVCDGKDNDCNGMIDDGPLPTIGDPCGNQVGACAGAVNQCINGAVVCSQVPEPERCDNIDNDCNGMVDENNPLVDVTGMAFPMKCGTDVGECSAGENICMNGAIVCMGASGTVNGQPELCNGKDDDCDGMIDEDPALQNLGPCGTGTCSANGAPCESQTDCPGTGNTCNLLGAGTCMIGTLQCVGGGVVCTGSSGPTFEICDGIDNDCDGVIDNGFDLANDPRNCGACNHVCMLDHAVAGCAAMQCTVASCEPGFFDIDHDPTNGCEYACQIQGPAEACNGLDDNCNGEIDEGLTPPNICNQTGACAGTVAVCTGAGGWKCVYNSNVSQDGDGNIIPETKCDGLDNDCDGRVDEAQPNLGDACHDSGLGVCQGTGNFVCDGANPFGPAVCDITTMGGSSSPEVCDGLDNDCDGNIDEGAETGNLTGQEWVTIAGTTQIMKYEASRPDASAGGVGTDQLFACSRAGVQPWTDVTYPQAVAACASVGARLCTETEWQASCAPPTTVTYPVNGPASTTDYVLIEAEQAFANVAATSGGTLRSFQVESPSTSNFSGASDLIALPNTGASITNTNAPTQSPRLDFKVNFLSTGSYFVWVRVYAQINNDNGVYADINATPPHTPSATVIAASEFMFWKWTVSPAFTVSATGNSFVSIYMRRDGVRVDAIAISKDGAHIPPFDDKVWAYGANPKQPQPQVCNDNEFDTDPLIPGDQDNILPTGSLPMCFANGPGGNDAFDMSGNVKEWCSARAAGQNPIRGGSSNTDVGGTTCGLNFTLADDSFFFPNVGFRCCR